LRIGPPHCRRTIPSGYARPRQRPFVPLYQRPPGAIRIHRPAHGLASNWLSDDGGVSF
jgi:hypothetical protein